MLCEHSCKASTRSRILGINVLAYGSRGERVMLNCETAARIGMCLAVLGSFCWEYCRSEHRRRHCSGLQHFQQRLVTLAERLTFYEGPEVGPDDEHGHAE